VAVPIISSARTTTPFMSLIEPLAIDGYRVA